MAEITAALVKQLRDKTGAGMMDAKKALVENNGDIAASADWLREKGILKAAKKADRIAAEGLLACDAGTAAAVVEVNSKPTSSARTPSSRLLSETSLSLGQRRRPGEDVARGRPQWFGHGGEMLRGLAAKIGENMSLRRATRSP
jgi:elongation factor Ts